MPGGSVTNWSRSRLALSTRREPLRALHARAPDPRRDERLPGLPAGAPAEDLVRQPFHSDGYGFQVELVMRAWTPRVRRRRDRRSRSASARTATRRSRGGIVVEALWLVTVWGLKARLRGAPAADRRIPDNGHYVTLPGSPPPPRTCGTCLAMPNAARSRTPWPRGDVRTPTARRDRARLAADRLVPRSSHYADADGRDAEHAFGVECSPTNDHCVGLYEDPLPSLSAARREGRRDRELSCRHRPFDLQRDPGRGSRRAGRRGGDRGGPGEPCEAVRNAPLRSTVWIWQTTSTTCDRGSTSGRPTTRTTAARRWSRSSSIAITPRRRASR